MKNFLIIKNKLKPFNKVIEVDSDKSLSIRWAILASLAIGKSKAHNILVSDDVKSSLLCLKKLGVEIKIRKNYCEIDGRGVDGYKFKKNITLNAGNSGTLARLILACLVDTPYEITLIGDKSLSQRDFSRVTKPLKKFGVTFSKSVNLPLKILGTNKLKPIKYFENKGSAQVKTSIMIAALKTEGKTEIIAKKSRNHSEILFKQLKIPIKIKKTKKFDIIEISGKKKIQAFDYKLPGDISSASFFIVLTLLSKKSQILIKNVNVNSSRVGIIKILNKMGAQIKLTNKKSYKGEKIADIFVKSTNKLKAINCPTALNTSAIDEFLIIFLVAARAKGISYFRKLSELNHKESPRLKWGSSILNKMGIKNELTSSSLKVFGNPEIKINKSINIMNYLKDHRIFMMSTIAALTFGGKWKINDVDSINTSFPSFLKIIKKINRK